MFERYLTAVGLLALCGLVGCSSHRTAVEQPVPRPLWDDIPAYQAPLEPDSPETPHPVPQEPVGELTLRDALGLSLLHNPRLADVAWSVRISEARAVQAGLLPNPDLEVEVENFSGTGTLAGFSAAETTVRLSQLIELGGKRGARLRVAGVETTLANYDYETQRLTVLTDATLAYIDVIVAQEQLDLADGLLKLSQKTFDVVDERVKAGKVSPLERTKASIELVNRKIARMTARSDLTITRRRLAATWGGQAPQFLEATGLLDEVGDIPPFDVLELFIDQNPQVARWAEEMEHRLAELARERAQRMFDLTLSAGVRRFEGIDGYGFTIGVGLPLPLFDRNQGGVREAGYRLAQTGQRAADAKTRITTALVESYEALTSARMEALALQNEVVPSARSSIEAARDGYRQGKFGYLEVLDSEHTLAETNARLLDALGRYHRAVTVVESLVGTKLETVINEGSTELEERK